MEAYALMALGGLGMYAAQAQNSQSTQSSQNGGQNGRLRTTTGERPIQARPMPGNAPSASTVYDSTYLNHTSREEKRRATAMDRSARMSGTNVISRNHRLMEQPPSKVRSQLAGIDIPLEHFTHNNMTPFFRGDMKQNMDPRANSAIMENMTGRSLLEVAPRRKQEVEKPMSKERDVGNQYGTPLQTDSWRDRMVQPRIRNNEFPEPKVTVGPGIGRGFEAAPSDGYMDQRKYMMPRDTDVVRAANNPKTTFNGRVLAGQGPAERGRVGEVKKNRPETMAEMRPDAMQPTTGAFLRDTQRPVMLDRPTARQGTTQAYTGAAFASGIQKTAQERPQVALSKARALGSLQTGPVAAMHRGGGSQDDKGRASIQVYSNARDTTTANVHQGNLSSFVKMITAPLLDVLKPNRASCPHIVSHPRQDGHFKGPARTRVYDPDDVARTTLREGLSQSCDGVNLRGPSRLQVHDPQDTFRTTIKEVTLQEVDKMNLRGPQRITVHDPSDVMRTTLKEATLQEVGAANIAAAKQVKVYETDNGARVTLRETLAEEDGGPLKGLVPNPNVWDPSDVARATMKQMLADASREVGNPDGLQGQHGGYQSANVTSKQTQREVTSDADYIGQGKQDQGQGYTTAPTDLRPAAKAQLSDTDYFGGAAEQGPSAPAVQGATRVNDTRELTLNSRDPTHTGNKALPSAMDMGNTHVRRQDLAAPPEPATERVTPSLAQEEVALTHDRQHYGASLDQRFADEVSANEIQRTSNPLSLSLTNGH